MGHPRMSGTSTPSSVIHPTIASKTARTIPPSCSSRVTRIPAAIRCMPGKWQLVCRRQIVRSIPSCSTTSPIGATHRFSLYRPRSRLSPTDSLSSADRKMAARLQAANRSEHSILLDYKPNWGHTPVQPLSTKIEALADRLAFLCHELGVHVSTGGSRDAVLSSVVHV